MDRTSRTTSQMLNRYRRAARTVQELNLGCLLAMTKAIPELDEFPAIAPNAASLGSDKTETAPQLSSGRRHFSLWASPDLNREPTD
jgi:hypothetical protein